MGLFHVRSATGDEAEARIITASGFIDSFGLAYRPGSPPEGADHRRYRHLYGPWYRYWKRF